MDEVKIYAACEVMIIVTEVIGGEFDDIIRKYHLEDGTELEEYLYGLNQFTQFVEIGHKEIMRKKIVDDLISRKEQFQMYQNFGRDFMPILSTMRQHNMQFTYDERMELYGYKLNTKDKS